MPKYSKGKRVIEATKRAFEVIYKAQGYKEHKETEEKAEVKLSREEFEELTVPELKDMARDADLSGYSSLNKGELIDLLVGE